MKLIAKKYGMDEDVIKELNSIESVEIEYLTDTNVYSKEWANKKVLTSYQSVEKYKKKEVDGFIIWHNVGYEVLLSMIEELCTYGVLREDIYILCPEFKYEKKRTNIIKLDDYSYLPYLEYHVADHCNLNCKGCVHFSPLVENAIFPQYEDFSRDLKQLKKHISYIGEIHILGGEPLLNKELNKYIELTREVYPYSNIKIVTNGLLIKSIKEGLMNCIKNNDIEIAISLYKPMFEKIDQTIYFLEKNEIKYHCSNPVGDFSYTFDLKGGHAAGVKRLNCSCPNLYKGKLAICPPIAYIKYFNERYKTKFSETEGLIDIYDESISYEQIVSELKKPLPICDCCLFISREHAISQPWQQSTKKTINDYAINSINSI